MKTDKNDLQNRMSQDIHNTSRTIQPGSGNQQKQVIPPSSKYDRNLSGKAIVHGRDWHEAAKAHVKVGSQGHKRSGNRHS
ncbi:hypothetical protein [Pontibacter cellulosilyticus]|uniref:Uncharacterized protein n=1 Tax=Pontibacter cellulosilyticus TaxID=1720253 RepID=A0A923SN69_9BACT|nr:hypothetical protein [Pontibacter cellulosilyticus]MBC5992890.1 hypothetical protein [Pontibacter cellulosilyticus]